MKRLVWVQLELSGSDKDWRTLGPFEEVQIAYSTLLSSPDATPIAEFVDGYWFTPDGERWTDIIIYTREAKLVEEPPCSP